ncbi:helix-turn-helix transcriptional regulator [Pectinatus cerevisiiphilus]|uniref:DNA-binding XRE family transcriptional regulator n=1 Tax=Pectinatus cerevisiiphilus TaxID=86956 RepID=A0A4R3K3Q0_9FIRM|nr:helix-turn-helix transcriptional regulator [Pectinatus cerevisiiphilus]TCS77271.1 DNA-binding XRE family transcriptional regulator [Pectinatus cerevisiiphilus]
MNIIEEKRLRLGLTQKQLADKIGVDRTTVGKWELGISIPRIEKLLILAKTLDCSIEDIYSCQKERLHT